MLRPLVTVRGQLSAVRIRVFDLRNGVDTREDFSNPEMPSGPAFDDAVRYERVSPRVFSALMAELDVPDSMTFIDVGCGKGAALLMALEHGFRSVIGVELNDRLVQVARRNVDAYQIRRRIDAQVEVVQADAAEFHFPDAPTLLFLFNPFGAETLRAMLGNLEVSLRRHPRELSIAYVNPKAGEELDNSPAFRRVPTRAAYCAVYSWAAPAS